MVKLKINCFPPEGYMFFPKPIFSFLLITLNNPKGFLYLVTVHLGVHTKAVRWRDFHAAERR